MKEYPRQDQPWIRGMQALYTEHDVPRIAHIEGTLPPDLKGTLYRVGPGKHDVNGHDYHHWFDGDGMVSAFRFEGDHVAFKNRYVRTPWYEAEQQAGKLLYMNFGTPFPGGMLRAAWQGKPKNPANTNVVVHNNKLLTFWEGGRPFALDPDSLCTLGEEDFSGALSGGMMFSAHPHFDPHTGDFYNISTAFGRSNTLSIWRVSPDGNAEHVTKIKLKRPYMIHDFGVTESKIIVLGGALYMETGRLLGQMLGLRALVDCFEWHDEPMCVYVIDRNGVEKTKRYELDTAMMIHMANAYEENGDIVMDACLFTDTSPIDQIRDAYRGIAGASEPSQLYRLRFKPNGTAIQTPVCDASFEFPRTNEHYSTQKYTCTYGVEFEQGNFGSSRLLKIYPDSGNTLVHDFGAGCLVGEPVFVPRPDARREDDGWLLSMVYDANDHHTFVGIVPADGMGKTETRVHLPFHVPLAFHGSFSQRN